MSAGKPEGDLTPFPVWGATKETFGLLWTHRYWVLIRALPSTIFVGVTFIVTFPRIGLYALWEIALFLISALFISNMMVSSNRLIVLGDACRRFADFLPRINDLTYLGVWLLFALAKWFLDAVGAFLGSIARPAETVFDLGVAILFFIALVRLIGLFPLIAIQGKTPFRTAWKLSAGHIERLIGYCIVVGALATLFATLVATGIYFSQQWLTEGANLQQMPEMAVNLIITLPFFIGALLLMVVLQCVAVAQSVAYRHLTGAASPD